MKPTALLLLAGIAICMLVVIFAPKPAPTLSTTTSSDHSHSHTSDSSSHPLMKPATAPEGVSTLQITDVVVGEGAEAVPGKRLTVQYTGWIYDANAENKKGNQFDSSKGRGPFDFRLDRSEVIRGWDQGVNGMKVGGKRILVIPAHLGYGDQGSGQIPPGASLMFEVELEAVN